MGSVQAGERQNSCMGPGVSRRVADKALVETDSSLPLQRAVCTGAHVTACVSRGPACCLGLL